MHVLHIHAKAKENLFSYAFENSISLIDVHAINLHNTLHSKIGLVPNTAADKPDPLYKSLSPKCHIASLDTNSESL